MGNLISNTYWLHCHHQRNMGLYVHRNHSGLLGTGNLISNTYWLHCHHHRNMGLYVHRNHSGLLGTGNLISNTYWLHCHRQRNMGLYDHRNHSGLLGTGNLISSTYWLHCHHQNHCIQVGSGMRHFNVSLIMRAKSQDSVDKPPFFLRERRAEADRTEVLLLTSLAPYR